MDTPRLLGIISKLVRLHKNTTRGNNMVSKHNTKWKKKINQDWMKTVKKMGQTF